MALRHFLLYVDHAAVLKAKPVARMAHSIPPELRWLFPRIRPHLRLHIGSFLLVTAASLLGLIAPLCMRRLIDSILPAHNGRLAAMAIGLIFVSYEGRSILSACGSYLTFRATQGTAVALRLGLLQHLDTLSADHFDQTPVGDLLYPFEAPIDEISFFGSDLVPSLLRAATATAVAFSAMASLNPLLTVVIVPIIPAFLFLRHRCRNRMAGQADVVQEAKRRFSRFLQEHLNSSVQIQLLRQTRTQECVASQLLETILSTQARLWRTGLAFSAVSNLAIAVAIALTLAGGSRMVFRGMLSIGTLVAFYALLTQIFEPLTAAVEMYSRAQRTFASIRQIRGCLEKHPTVIEHKCAMPIDGKSSFEIVLRDVSFRYQQAAVVVRIPHLTIDCGEILAIVGRNGAGKSTLAKLLARLYDVDTGEIVIAGRDIRHIALESLRAAVCYLPTHPMLFHRSLIENLRIGKPTSTHSEIANALAAVEFTKPLEAQIEPSASNLSTGERQRVAIARALLQRPRVLVLDETTSSLDPASEERILRSIRTSLPQTTLVVVSHRLHSIAWMERMIVMHQGEIIRDSKSSVFQTSDPTLQQLFSSM